jgi:GTPase
VIGRPPRVAVVGRQNVGKSTLVNRLFGRREAISHETPGVTRDRLEVETTWAGRRFGLVDTGGFARRARGIEALVARQAERAAEQADLVLVVVDGETGIREEDELLARRLRRASVPVLVVVNKVDSAKEEPDAEGFHRLGLGEPMAVSALHGRGTGELLDRIVALLPEASAEPEIEREPRFALVGRPNVGKSSLFNRLVGEERSVVYEEAGTTRDSVDAVIQWPAGPVRFVDTAGLRRSTKARGVEYYSLVRAVRAIDRAHVVAVVLDAADGFTSEDKRIAARVMAAGRALLIVANKWDLVGEKDPTFKALQGQLGPFSRAQVLRTSALRGGGVHRLPPTLTELHARWSKRVPTSVVNRIVREAQDERPAPFGTSRYRYATQVAAGPPTFVLFGGRAPDAGYRRYLEGRLRAHLGFDGVPLRLMFRSKRPRAAPGVRRVSHQG